MGGYVLAGASAALMILARAGAAHAAGAPLPPSTPAVAAARAEVAAWPAYKTSEEEYAALKAKAAGHGAKVGWDKLPDWNGVWESETLDRFDGYTRNTDGSLAPLNAKAAAAYKALLDDANTNGGHDHLTQCLPSGFPRSAILPFQTEFIVTPERTHHIAEEEGETRKIYTDGRPHMAEDEAYPLWSGDAIGFWDGDVLVVHTNHLRAYESGYQRFGPPQSDQTSTVERIWRAGPDQMIEEISVYDPVNLTKAWRAVHSWRRVKTPGARIDTWSCAENSNAAINADGTTRIILPGEPGSGAGLR